MTRTAVMIQESSYESESSSSYRTSNSRNADRIPLGPEPKVAGPPKVLPPAPRSAGNITAKKSAPPKPPAELAQPPGAASGSTRQAEGAKPHPASDP